MAGSVQLRPARLSGSRGPAGAGWTGVEARSRYRGHRAWAQSGRREATTPVPGGRGGPRPLAGSPSQDLVPVPPLAWPRKRRVFGRRSGVVGFGGSGPSSVSSVGLVALPAWSAREFFFCGAAIGEGQEEFFLYLCICEYLQKGGSSNLMYVATANVSTFRAAEVHWG